jgi:riboflavin synthase
VCTVFASQETLGKTTLGQKRRGDKVNLERPLGVSGRFGGHIVTGHVDVVGRIKSIRQNGETRTLAIAFPATMRHFIVSKGSISVDGISLTILNLHDNLFSICVIPHTWKNTTMQWKTPGDPVNLEFDILAKYLYAWAHGKMEGAAAELPLQKGTKLTRELLERTGFT